ncbi:FAD-binding oxidoreductase [Halalkaliarchaeum sp. AArc-GB]|uniref:NAD(P)/FAD-dependent oxidoreductase n=1 Tax=Halalkaliarchaeum sp. AArc-GB TaxID=3074078 RepID=UPI002855317D|nr:FAD-binding oxidoreductase [Halalkaliarchaeum sp. AArc-GB]MDR5672200.1 FAD-binding oxidoreductase [Halalkaliarchaeum sp. AArc-GB]
METAERLPSAVDVIIVGGGIVGTSAAYFLATETDRKTLLIERDGIASGSTGDSSAIIRHHYGDRETYSRLADWSHEFFRNFEERTGEPIAYTDNPLVRLGKNGEPSGEYAQAGYETLSELGIPVSRYGREELERRYPMLSVEDVDFAVSDDTAAYSDASDVAGGFARAAQREGATVVTDVEAEDLLTEDGGIVGIETDAGPIQTDDVIVAAGPWSGRIAGWVGVDIPMRLTREQILLLEPPEEFDAAKLENLPTTGKPDADWYLRPDFGEGVLIATHHVGETVDPDTYKRDPDEETILKFIEELEEFAPGLADSKLRGGYCGVYSDTPDRGFVIDQAGPDGCYFACGFSGHGFKTAPAVGSILADLLTEGDSELADLEEFSLERFEEQTKPTAND